VPQLVIDLIADIIWKKTMVMKMMMDEYKKELNLQHRVSGW